MTVDEIIMTVLAPTGLPVAASPYTGDASKYITFDYYTRPAAFADDAPECEIYHVGVDLIAPAGENVLALKKQIKSLLFAADFTYPEETNASGDKQHYVFECEYAAEV
jgi:hypothetical protein